MPADHQHQHQHPHPHEDPHAPLATTQRALRIGIGGPVGSGKTALVAALCRQLAGDLRLGVVTNDIYTTEDADFLRRNGVLPAERIRAVETGCCPHTAIRDDISANLDAIEELEADLGPLDLVLVESGGDNLTATFSRGLDSFVGAYTLLDMVPKSRDEDHLAFSMEWVRHHDRYEPAPTADACCHAKA